MRKTPGTQQTRGSRSLGQSQDVVIPRSADGVDKSRPASSLWSQETSVCDNIEDELKELNRAAAAKEVEDRQKGKRRERDDGVPVTPRWTLQRRDGRTGRAASSELVRPRIVWPGERSPGFVDALFRSLERLGEEDRQLVLSKPGDATAANDWSVYKAGVPVHLHEQHRRVLADLDAAAFCKQLAGHSAGHRRQMCAIR